jgi:hypothetical protein
VLLVGGAAGMRNQGAYNAAKTYFPNDLVQYLGSTYMATSVVAGASPTDATYWAPLAMGYTAGVPAEAVSATRTESTVYGMAGRSTSTSPLALTMDGQPTVVTGAAGNVLELVPYTNVLFELKLTARRAGVATISQGWSHQGMIVRDAGNARIVGSVAQVATWSEGASLGTVSFSASANYLRVQVTPSATAATIWNGRLSTTELTLSS